tara:strand:- start:8343 stop:8876 length:534 start_codon:yes stop_codon:yes gene_type:complete
MQRTTASIRYAKALFYLALEETKSNEVLIDLNKFLAILDKEEQLVSLVSNPTVKYKIKQKLFKKLFKDIVNPLTMDFLQLVIKKGREAYIKDIIFKYEELYNNYNNISVVQVVSAEPLTDQLKDSIKKKLSYGGGEVKLKEIINKNLLGGFIIKRGDMQYDASIKKKLRNAKRAFKL